MEFPKRGTPLPSPALLDASEAEKEEMLRDVETVFPLLRRAQREQRSLSPALRDFLSSLAPELAELPGEKTAHAITALLLTPYPDKGMLLWDAAGFLPVLLPEIAALKNIAQPPQFHPEGDVFTHTMLMLSHMAYPDRLLAWSVLLHDVGKPVCFSREADGRIRFFNHEIAGCEIAGKILGRFGFSEEEKAVCLHAIRNHMRFGSVPSMRAGKVEALTRETNFPLELELHRLDCISSHGLMASFLRLLDFSARGELRRQDPSPWITGKELIELGLPPGPEFKKILSLFARKQREGAFTSPTEAGEALKRWFSANMETSGSPGKHEDFQ